MKHRRGIELDPAIRPLPIRIVGEASELAWLTFAKIPSGSALGARCGRCSAVDWLDRYRLELRFGSHALINPLAARLVCRSCGNRGGNAFLIGRYL